jgi:hypothetical protein
MKDDETTALRTIQTTTTPHLLLSSSYLDTSAREHFVPVIPAIVDEDLLPRTYLANGICISPVSIHLSIPRNGQGRTYCHLMCPFDVHSCKMISISATLDARGENVRLTRQFGLLSWLM